MIHNHVLRAHRHLLAHVFISKNLVCLIYLFGLFKKIKLNTCMYLTYVLFRSITSCTLAQ
jgi:hypothetical protein